jgi:Fe-S cluster assembly protein SufD
LSAPSTSVASEILNPETGGFSGKPHSHGATPVPGDRRGERHRSFELADFDVPTGREEDWRFTPLHRLRHLHEDDTPAEGSVSVQVDAAPEVQVETVARGDARLGKAGVPADRVAARAWSSFEKATVLTVPRDVVVSAPTVVTVRGDGDGKGAAFGHLLVDVQQFAQALVVLDHVGSATYADNVEFLVGDGARLTVVVIDDWADDAVHVTQHSVTVGRDATFKSIVVSFGGDLVRVAS